MLNVQWKKENGTRRELILCAGGWWAGFPEGREDGDDDEGSDDERRSDSAQIGMIMIMSRIRKAERN
jgi:hypothetical protein